jgi:hypothetical protein
MATITDGGATVIINTGSSINYEYQKGSIDYNYNTNTDILYITRVSAKNETLHQLDRVDITNPSSSTMSELIEYLKAFFYSDVSKSFNKGSFGETITAHKTPSIQIANKYEQDPLLMDSMEVFSATGGTADNSVNLFRCQTGTSIGGYGVVRSKNTINYRAGQGVEAQFTASFTTGVALSLQFGGMFSLTETLAFGFDGVDFSCLHSYGGAAEVQLITVTATGAGTTTVTLDGDAVGITTTAGTVQTVAEELRAGLFADSTLTAKWRFEQVDDMVYCISKSVGNKTNTMSVTGASTATITEQTTGVVKTDAHTAQSAWNVTTSPFEGFDPTKLNVYKIQFGYLGAANINYFIYNPNTGSFVLVHSIKWANTSNITHIGSPNLKVGWTSASLGASGTNLTVTGASASLMNEGDEKSEDDTFAFTAQKSSVDTTQTNIITIKNRVVYADRFNLGKVKILRLSIDNDHTKGLSVKILRNATISGTANYQFEEENNSIAILDTAGDTVSNGSLIDGFEIGPNASAGLNLEISPDLLPEDTITVSANTVSGSGATVTAVLTWREEK